VRFGYRRATVILRRDGWRVNPKRIYRLYTEEAKLCYTESVLMENRNGLIVNLRVSQATGRAECEQGLAMLEGVGGLHRITVAADKSYDRAEFVAGCRALNVTPHVAQNERRPGGLALNLRTTGWPGYGVSQRVRKMGRRDLRLAQEGRQLPPHPLSRRGAHPPRRLAGRRGLQPPEYCGTLSERMNRATSARHLPPPDPWQQTGQSHYSLRHRDQTKKSSRFHPFLNILLGLYESRVLRLKVVTIRRLAYRVNIVSLRTI
jgi:hypothetical protein